ncbi:MAG: oligosaccharide flippase family protein [Planctomycetaceae bacterium]|nr:oligosaccharide flippase family protein [Planctomycetaceae bacterium]
MPDKPIPPPGLDQSPPWQLRAVSVLWDAIGTDGQEAFRKLIGMVGISLFTQLAALTSLYLIVDSLSVAEFGVLSSALAVQSFGTILSTLGIRPILVRELSRNPERRDELCSAYTLIAMAGGTIVAGIVYVVLIYLDLQATESFVFQIVACGTALAAINPAPIFDADGKQLASTVLTSIAEIAALATVATLWNQRLLSLIPIAVIFAGKWFAMSALSWGYLFYKRKGYRWCLSLKELQPLLRASTPLSGAAMLQTAMISSGPILARTLGGQTAAGIYGLAHQALTAHILIMGLVGRIVAPRVAVRYQEPGFLFRAGLAYVGVACCLTFVGIVSGLFVLQTFLDPAFHAAGWPITIVLVALVIRSLGIYSNLAHIVTHRETVVFLSGVVGVLVVVPLVVALPGIVRSLSLQVPSSLSIVLGTAWLCTTVVSLLAHRHFGSPHETHLKQS